MSFIKINDEMPQHPKIVAAGPVGLALAIAALCYANRTRTDGYVPHVVARQLLQISRPKPVIDRLVKAGVWTVVEGGYQIHEYADHQRTREQIDQITEARRFAGSLGGRAKQTASRSPKEYKKKSNKEEEKEEEKIANWVAKP